MLKFFKRRRPEPAHRAELAPMTIQDLLVARWWGYTPAEWDALPSLVKVDKREQVVYAQFGATK